jgi:phosphoribosylformylglycinamidine synthase
MLKFEVDAKNKKIAEKTVVDLCNEFRIFNPLVSQVTVESSET